MLDMISNFLTTVDDFVWGIPLIVLILATGLFLTARLRFLQITKLPHAIKHLIANEKSGEDGEVSSFAALCTALSATIGTGNIVGVATAIVAGGPGALFWMWIAALVGTATKYSECLLAVKYRVVAEDGHIIGGPFYYIENGMGKSWKWLAKIFAFMGVCVGLFGIGTFTQINGITSAVHNFFDANNAHTVQLFGMDYSWSVVISGILLTICVALVVIGGLKRISTVAQVIVPFISCQRAVDFVGMPEAYMPLAETTIYLALARKSNSSYAAYLNARREVRSQGPLSVPLHLRTAVTPLQKEWGYGRGYKYPHAYRGGYVEQDYLPDGLVNRRFYKPSANGDEPRLSQWWRRVKNIRDDE